MTALTGAEQAELNRCERIIRENLKGFIAAGTAFAAVRDKRLYRQRYATFEDYCEQEHGLSRSHVYRLIDAAQVAEDLSPIGGQPNERQARPLVPLEPAERLTVWQEATRGGNRPTAARVEELVHQLRGRVGAETHRRDVEREERAALEREREDDQHAALEKGIAQLRIARKQFTAAAPDVRDLLVGRTADLLELAERQRA